MVINTKISALIITKNEAHNIEKLIENLNFADEIIIVDSFSTDATEELATKFDKVKFYKHKFENYASQRNIALGYATNPWILKVDTAKNIPTFTQDVGSSKNTETGDVTYMALEAPLYEVGARDAIGADAYKLKLAMWADAFQRNPNIVEGTTTAVAGQNPLDSGMIARIRLQAIWNNFSINGSKIQLFQTLGGSTNTGGMSVFYNNTLGLAGVIRLNSGDGSKLLGSAASGKWLVPAGLNNHVFRLSTQECGVGNLNGCTAPAAQGILSTPALDKAVGAPVFDAKEGVFIYDFRR